MNCYAPYPIVIFQHRDRSNRVSELVSAVGQDQPLERRLNFLHHLTPYDRDMAPLISCAKVTLSYPLYACDFDPLDSSRLVVGGGGGAGRSGVGNKIVSSLMPTTCNNSNARKLLIFTITDSFGHFEPGGIGRDRRN
jgi:hypothetical protein